MCDRCFIMYCVGCLYICMLCKALWGFGRRFRNYLLLLLLKVKYGGFFFIKWFCLIISYKHILKEKNVKIHFSTSISQVKKHTPHRYHLCVTLITSLWKCLEFYRKWRFTLRITTSRHFSLLFFFNYRVIHHGYWNG